MKWYNQLKEKGLCTRCAKKRLHSQSYCEDCIVKNKEHARLRNQTRIANGLCIQCGDPSEASKQRCTKCLEYNKLSVSKRRSALQQEGKCVCGADVICGKEVCASCLKKRSDRWRALRTERVKNKVCVKCGNKDLASKNLCLFCKSKLREYASNKKADRIKNGICSYCGIKQLNNSGIRCDFCCVKIIIKSNLNDMTRVEELLALFEQQNRSCPYLGVELQLGVNASLDHKIPRSKNGGNNIANLQWVHKFANCAKNNFSEEEFLAFVKQVAIFKLRMCDHPEKENI